MDELAGLDRRGQVGRIKDHAPILGRKLFVDEDFIDVLYFFHDNVLYLTFAGQAIGNPLFLAMPAIKGAPACLDYALYRILAPRTGQALAGKHREALIETSLLSLPVPVITHRRAAVSNGLFKDFHDVAMNGIRFYQADPLRPPFRIKAAAKQISQA